VEPSRNFKKVEHAPAGGDGRPVPSPARRDPWRGYGPVGRL